MNKKKSVGENVKENFVKKMLFFGFNFFLIYHSFLEVFFLNILWLHYLVINKDDEF